MSEGIGTLERHIVIGAGPVGLAMAAALKHRGVPFDLVDAAPGVGADNASEGSDPRPAARNGRMRAAEVRRAVAEETRCDSH